MILKFLRDIIFGAGVDSPAPSQEERSSNLGKDFVSSGASLKEWLSGAREGGRLYVDISDDALKRLKRDFPALVISTVKAADTVIEHKFDLLGSGPVVYADPERQAKNGYTPIDWYLDPVRDLRFPRGIHHKSWDLYKMRPGLADVKYPWELSRLQHFVTLGQAHRLTSDDRYAAEIFRQIEDFMEANPVGYGVNWTCTMDVAIRAANMAMGLALVRRSGPAFEEKRWREAHEALFDHGVFIYGNLENNYEVTSNHFLSNVVGLYFLSSVFAGTTAAVAWDSFCRASLEQEIVKQILDDGADYESSVPYHRLVLELFLGAARLARFKGEPLSGEYDERLRIMTEYLLGVMRPDGLMPQSGDADDGRLHIFSEYGSWNPQDGRHILAPAGHHLNEPLWKTLDGERGAWEAAWWGFGETAGQSAQKIPPISKLFPQAGHAVCRENDNYLLVTNSIVGTKGFGNHKHNDQLAFEYHCGGKAIVVDAGSYVYTSDPPARNLFRSVGYHNTMTVDNTEQNEFNPEWLFRMFEKANAEHLGYEDNGEYVQYRGRHTGYSRLENPVTHERLFRFYKATGELFITDILTGSGEHDLKWHFHFAPQVDVAKTGDGVYSLTSGGGIFKLVCHGASSGEVTQAWYSPSYGARLPCLALDIVMKANIENQIVRSFALGPEKHMTGELAGRRMAGILTEMTGRSGVAP